MPEITPATLREHLNKLTAHLEQENPDLVEVVRSFRRLDRVAYKLGLLDANESYAAKVTWWPLISVLGTFSSGKSTFINNLLGQSLQATGSQAVDDKFTVICYGRSERPQVLPALALDGDPRFPFYNFSREIDEVTQGEGKRLDSYLQLKTCNSPQLRGKIFIDSPGFDADAQRTETLKITNHIIDLSDLVLVFFDARHPEPGAMRDTLEYLVTGTMRRPDFNKFVHILNQIDNAAREDNPEEVFAAWQRALANAGLTAGRFYRIYDPKSAIKIEDPNMRARFEAKRDADMEEIVERIRRLEVERAYRVVGILDQTAARIREEFVPRIRAANRVWRARVWRHTGLVFLLVVLAALGTSIGLGYWQGLRFVPPWQAGGLGQQVAFWAVVAAVVLLFIQVHRLIRRWATRSISADIMRDEALGTHAEEVDKAFRKNVRSWWRPYFIEKPRGWGRGARKRIDAILAEADRAIQTLNDRYANPAGPEPGTESAAPAPALAARSAANAPPIAGGEPSAPASAGPGAETPGAGSAAAAQGATPVQRRGVAGVAHSALGQGSAGENLNGGESLNGGDARTDAGETESHARVS
ncbi:MAG TPA: dynamin family protein [Gammaproteobacteria bacterium]|nr:dynamin family protein [Gammaproteobacteria bacterium]